MNAVAYLRVSSSTQLDGAGFDRQIEACEKLASKLGFEIVQVFREDVSGSKDGESRPVYQSMLESLAASGVAVVLVEHLDRLARYYRVQESMLYDLLNRGLTLYAANTGENITEAIKADPMRKALVQIQGIFAELDRSMIINKLNKGRAAKKAAGGKAEGRYPYGCDPHRPDESPILARMRDLKSSGMTTDQIASELNVSGLCGRSGCVWKQATVAKILRRYAA